MSIAWGFAAGLLSGAIMAFFSHLAWRLRLFGSSMIVVDGSFAARMLGKGRGEGPDTVVYLLGTVVHLVTSGVFGALYPVVAALLRVDSQSATLVAGYVFLLWLAMLFSALPMAGLGLFGSRAGRWTWLEQLVLHVVFGLVFWCLAR